MKPFKVYTSDLTIVDVIAKSDESPEIQVLIKKYGLQPGSKGTIDTREKFEEFAKAFKLEEKEKIPGGSSANTMVTLGRMLKGVITTIFFGLTGQTDGDERIREEMKNGFVTLVPPQDQIPAEPPSESAISFVVKFPPNKDGIVERSISTWPGNAKEKLNSAMIDSQQVQDSDAVFVQLGLQQKMQETRAIDGREAEDHQLGIADKLLKLRWEKGDQDLWLAMPTQADFTTKGGRSHAAKVKLFQKLTESANVILSNGEELARVFTDEDDSHDIEAILRDRCVLPRHYKDKHMFHGVISGLIEDGDIPSSQTKKFNFFNQSVSTQVALERLQKEFREVLLIKRADEDKWHGNTRQVAFITLGEEGAALVTKDDIIRIPAVAVGEKEMKGSTLGCGDTAYAGFLASYVKQHLHEKDLVMSADELRQAYIRAANTGVALASAKLKEVEGPRLSEPMQSLAVMHKESAAHLKNGHWIGCAQRNGDEQGVAPSHP